MYYWSIFRDIDIEQVKNTIVNIDWFQFATRLLIGVMTGLIIWALKLLWNIWQKMKNSGNREKVLEAQLKQANDEILALYDRKDEDRLTIERQHQNLLQLAARVDALEERAEAAEAKATAAEERVIKLEAVLATHNIRIED